MADTILDQLLSRSDCQNSQPVWKYFLDLNAIPRQSGHEEKVVDYLIDFAKSRGFVHEKDSVNNVLIEIPGTSGHESDPGYIVQSHMDMVCVGTPDPAVNGVTARIDGDWLKATNTSLGGDDGIGVASALALTDLDFPHAPLALVFTVDEECGLKGATNLSFTNPLTKYKYLVNVDSETLGQATISCAGGGDTVITLPFTPDKNTKTFSLKIDGLPGGHSGDDINKNRPNSIKMAASMVKSLKINYPNLQIVSFNAGQARNVIPGSAEVILSFGDSPSAITDNLLSLLEEIPHGVIKMSEAIPDLVETSNNLATISTQKDSFVIGTMTRSSVSADLDHVRSQITEIASKHQAISVDSPAYPGWPADPNSSLVKKVQEKYLEISDQPLEINAIHAGLECGVILGRYPHLEAVSFGPTLKDVHSVNESLYIPSVAVFLSLLKSVVC